MSVHSRITDDEMRYFQFKARQHFLIQKEDHEWNEFCRKNRCSCCSCIPSPVTKQQKEIGIQASAKVPLRPRTVGVKGFQDNELPESLNYIKAKLEKINLTLSEIKPTAVRNNMQKPEALFHDNKGQDSDSALNFLADQRKEVIKNSLMASLQRLHSFAMQRSTRPLSSPYIKNKSSSFMLPHDLQKQRTIARKTYLASLSSMPKIVNIKQKTSVGKKSNNKLHPRAAVPKPRNKKSISGKNQTEEPTLIQAEAMSETKDECIEKAVDCILDDLLREEILALNVIKQKKLEKQDTTKQKDESTNFQPQTKKREVQFHKLSPTSSAKIKENPFFKFKISPEGVENSRSVENTPTEHLDIQNGNKNVNCKDSVDQSFSEADAKKVKVKNPPASDKYNVLHVDPTLAKEVARQRKLYWQYLESISRTRTHNFDPWALSNMIAESLLDDCINDVCQELGDVPASLITDLYNQEFTPIIL